MIKKRPGDTELTPWIWRSKAGRITVIIALPHRRVKVYQAATSKHAHFLRQVLSRPDLAGKFHRLLFTWQRFVAAEWVEGSSLERSSAIELYPVVDWMASFQASLHTESPFAGSDDVGFDYVRWLQSEIFQHAPADADLSPMSELGAVAASAPAQPVGLCHPDVTPGNIIREATTGELKLVDNELLTQSAQFLLDLCNTCYSLRTSPGLMNHYLHQYGSLRGRLYLPNGWQHSLAAAWALRMIATHFRHKDFTQGLELLHGWEQGRDGIIAAIDSVLRAS